jgi:23S rRNA pseudouridine1911/1915/1917 synthase
MEIKAIVAPQEDGRELLGFLRRNLRLSMSMIRKLKQESGIFADGLPVYTNHKISAGEQIRVFLRESAPDIPPEEGTLEIVYEDEWLLIVYKPRGIFTHPSRSRYTGTLMNFVLKHIQDRGGEAVHAVNRLDRDTSGLVIFAKSAFSKALCGQIDMDKRYLALVWGVPDRKEDEIRYPIRRERERDLRRIVAPDGDRAVTHYRVEQVFDGFSLLSLQLETGRTHQIRVHCGAIGHPVLGDRLYGTAQSLELSAELGGESHMLHAFRLRFNHPVSGTALALDCLPDWKLFSGRQEALLLKE